MITQYDKYEGEITKRKSVDNITEINVVIPDIYGDDVLCGRKCIILIECEKK